MMLFTIKGQKNFTQQLFSGNIFDNFLMSEADFMTAQTISMDGRICRDYFDEMPENFNDNYVTWGSVRPVCFQIVKGRRLPVYFKVVLLLSKENQKKVLEAAQCGLDTGDVSGLFLNIIYKAGGLTCTSGTALNVFSMDKSLEKYWDKMAGLFLEKNNIL